MHNTALNVVIAKDTDNQVCHLPLETRDIGRSDALTVVFSLGTFMEIALLTPLEQTPPPPLFNVM